MVYSNSHVALEVMQILKSATITTPREEAFLQQVIQIIHANMDDEYFSVSHLAKQLYLSSSQVSRKLHVLVKQPAGQLIRQIRLRHAAHLLLHTTDSIGEIAFNVGFKNQGHFCRSFKQYFGCTPSSYIRQNYKMLE